jgi:hypothetical protein
MEIERVHLPRGKSRALASREPKKRPRRRHVKAGRVLAEVLQGRERLRALLHLIQDDEGLPLRDSGSRSGLYARQQAGDVVARLERGYHGQIPHITHRQLVNDSDCQAVVERGNPEVRAVDVFWHVNNNDTLLRIRGGHCFSVVPQISQGEMAITSSPRGYGLSVEQMTAPVPTS